jgi:hypothetical protein
MMGIPIEGPINTFCDCYSVLNIVAYPHSTLQKKHKTVAYHKVCKYSVSVIVQATHEAGDLNLS